MIYSFGKDDGIKNILRLVLSQNSKCQPESIEALRTYFLEFLVNHQRDCKVNFANKLISAKSSSNSFTQTFAESRIDDLYNQSLIGSAFSDEQSNLYSSNLGKAIDYISTKDEDAVKVFHLYINEVGIQSSNTTESGKTAFGGSSSKSIGKIWLSPRDDFQIQDYIELIAHELTHNMLFVDELNWGHFEYRNMHDPKYFAKSAILNALRPIDKVFHSIVVASEVLQWRQKFSRQNEIATVHPESNKIIKNTILAIESIESNSRAQSLLKPRAIEILEHVKSQVQPQTSQEACL